MESEYETKMAHAESCMRIVGDFKIKDDPAGTPLRRNFASKAQNDWMEVVRCYKEAMDVYVSFGKIDDAKRLLDSLFDLVETCDEFTSDFAIHLLLALQASTEWLKRNLPEIRDDLKIALRKALGQKLLEYEMNFWLLAAPRSDDAASKHRSAFELLRDLADNDEERGKTDEEICQMLRLAAQISLYRGNLDTAVFWYDSAARIAQERIGNTELARDFLQASSTVRAWSVQRPHSVAFLQAVQADSSSREYAEATSQLNTSESLNVLVIKGMQKERAKRFLPLPEHFMSEYANVDDKLTKLLSDKRLLPDETAIEARAVDRRQNTGLVGKIESGVFVDGRSNLRGNYSIKDRLTEQYIREIAEIIGVLFGTWQELGALREEQIIAILKQVKFDYNWTIFEVGLAEHFRQSYTCATHIMIPQFENFVRVWARIGGLSTKEIKGGVAGEMPFNRLLKSNEDKMRALLRIGLFDLMYWYMADGDCPFGYRHKIAHGWIQQAECNISLSAMSIWLTMQIVNCD